MDGFSFNGTHCSTLGCWYRPDPKDRGSEMEDYEISDNYTANSNIITSDGGFLPHMAGQFIYLNGWKSIRLVSSPNRAVISEAMPESGTAEAPVVTMNEIEISGDGLDLTRLEIDYTPRVR